MNQYEFERMQLFKDWEVIMEFLIKPQPSSQVKKWYDSEDLEIFVWCPPKKCGEDGSTRLNVDKVTGKKTIGIYIKEDVLRSRYVYQFFSLDTSI